MTDVFLYICQTFDTIIHLLNKCGQVILNTVNVMYRCYMRQKKKFAKNKGS